MTLFADTFSETFTVEDATITYNWDTSYELTETLVLVDTFSTAWVVDKEYSETLSLVDSVLTHANHVLSEVLSLTDGDNQEIVQVTPNGSYMVVSSEKSEWHVALLELATILEEQGAPKTMTSYLSTHDGTNFAVAAIVKRH